MWRRREDLLNESLSLSYLPAEIGIGFLSPERDAPSVSPSSNFVLCNFCVTSSAPSDARPGIIWYEDDYIYSMYQLKVDVDKLNAVKVVVSWRFER